jgi:hypothetical protein
MAKRVSEIVIERKDLCWTVWADPQFDEEIKRVAGVSNAFRLTQVGSLTVFTDPRYDQDDLERELIELCR